MQRRFVLSVKIVLFGIIFFVLSSIIAFFIKNDSDAYTRILMYEFNNQENIDVIFCGASHVSHGIYPKLADEKFVLNTFCTGTPSQGIAGTYAILSAAVRKYKIKKVFLEMDFAVACRGETPFFQKTPSASAYLVSEYLADPMVKLNYLLTVTSPKYYLNSILPIGKDKLLDLNPSVVLKTIMSKIDGSYYRYEYSGKDFYAGKGCIFDRKIIANGTFSSGFEKPIAVENISNEWKNTVKKIVKLCKENSISIDFYSNPSSDFYLMEKSNYDEYVSFLRSFLNELGYEYYDFNFCRPEFLNLEDCDFSDDNHLNKTGIEKFTSVFCDFFTGKIESEKLFYKTYSEKIANQPPKIYGLMLKESPDKKSIEVKPVINNEGRGLVTYTIYALYNGKEELLSENTCNNIIIYPAATSGKLKILSFYDGILNNTIIEDYTAF